MSILHIVLLVLIILLNLCTLIFLIRFDRILGLLKFLGFILLELILTPFIWLLIQGVIHIYSAMCGFIPFGGTLDTIGFCFPMTVTLIAGFIVSLFVSVLVVCDY